MSFAGHVLDMIKRMEANRALQKNLHKSFGQQQTEPVDLAQKSKEKFHLNKKFKLPDADTIKEIEANARRRQIASNIRFTLLLIFIFLIAVFLFILFMKN
ncbi:MAG TPA: hypothetical protein PKC40_02700 [Saprospiraceae bacterium]|nr:hypothetical protein [Saprospiraceae bacterium]